MPITDWTTMKAFVSLLVLAAIAGGVVWYESQPNSIKIPMEAHGQQPDEEVTHQDPTTTEQVTTTTSQATTTTQPHQLEVDFSQPDLTLEVQGVNGDDVTLREVVGEPQQLGELTEEVRLGITGCPGVTERDMVVPVEVAVEPISSMAMDVSVDYQTAGHVAVFSLHDGLSCSDGGVTHHLQPGRTNRLRYWVVLSNVVGPDHPDGNFDSVMLTAPNLVLPGWEKMFYRFWGPRVVGCHGWWGDEAIILIVGSDPGDCRPATTQATAVGNM